MSIEEKRDTFFEELDNVTAHPVEHETEDKKRKQISDSKEMMRLDVVRPALVKSILTNICQKDAFICGGFARVACSPCSKPIPTSDIDIYLLREEDFDKVSKRIEDAKYIKVKENDVSHVYSFALESEDKLQINLIKPIQTGHLHTFGDLDAILQNFDFSIARVGVYLDDWDDISARGDVDFLEDEKAGYLNIKNIHCPVAEISRIVKYQAKGYKCPIIMILRCFMDWDERPLDFKSDLIAALTTDAVLSDTDVKKLYERLYID